MSEFRLAGKFMRALPFIGDAIGVAQELTNPHEPDMGQRLMNAGVVGLGEVGASLATGGMDFIPDVAELATALNLKASDPLLRRLQEGAPLANPEHYLRLLSYGGDHEPTKAYLREALETQLRPEEDQSVMGRFNRMRTPALGGLVLPTR